MTKDRVQHALEEIRKACARADGLPDDPDELSEDESQAFLDSDDPLPGLPPVAVHFINELIRWAEAGCVEAQYALDGLEQLGLVEFDDDPDGERQVAAA